MDTPRLLSIQVGKPKRHGTVGSQDDKPWQSGIFKAAVEGRVRLGSLNLEGDGQADLKNHGGPFRAVLGYSADHYPIWREELNFPDIPYGAFGENFTISGLDEETVCIGDIYSIGDEVQVQVSQPRMPCWKLARRWNMKDLTARVFDHAWGGWYHQVLSEGYVEGGMSIKLLDRPYPKFPVAYVYALMNEWMDVPEDVAALTQLEPLSPGWREHFARRLQQPG